MELGLHIANFTWTGGPAQLGGSLARLATTTEDAGFAAITVMDHLWQIGVIGPPEDEMLEAYTTLGFLAAHTERVRLHTLVTAVTYRSPGLLAKIVTTLDVLSGGRGVLGIGAAWNDEESTGLGLHFPPTAERFERLEETLQICLQMWSGSDAPYEGTHYQLGRTLNSPPSISQPRPRIMIGGTGERKTLRLVAKYADACNLFPGPDVAHKLDVLRRHCETEGRRLRQHREDDDDARRPVERTRRVHRPVAPAARAGVHRRPPLSCPAPNRSRPSTLLGAKVIPEISTW